MENEEVELTEDQKNEAFRNREPRGIHKFAGIPLAGSEQSFSRGSYSQTVTFDVDHRGLKID